MTIHPTYRGRTGPWEIVLGLEIHAQVAPLQLFSGAAVVSAPAERTGLLVDAAMPACCGDQRLLRRTGRPHGAGLKAQIHPWSRFDRKNYFYPTCLKAIRSASSPSHRGRGRDLVERDDGSSFTVRIERLHLEQDAGKSIHDWIRTGPSST